MANSNRVFVSPGVYTSEKDLSFVSQSVGVSTLGLVGETKKGPAFEPVLVSGYNEFRTMFGGQSPEKLGETLKYPLPYYAKSYLSQSSQLFVTRVLGYSGYDAGNAHAIKTIGNIDISTIGNTSNQVASFDVDINGGVLDLSGLGATELSYLATSFEANSGVSQTVEDFFNTNITSSHPLVMGPYFTNEDWSLISVDDSSLVTFGMADSKWAHQTCTDNTLSESGFAFYGGVWDDNGQDKMRIIVQEVFCQRYADVHDKTIAILRSRAEYTGDTLNHVLTGGISISGSAVEFNALSDFSLSANGANYICNMSPSSKKFITKVIGEGAFDKNPDQYPVYVDKIFDNYLNWLIATGKVKGLHTGTLEMVADGDDFKTKYSSSVTPYVVSEVRGGLTSDLFRFVTISDGDSSAQEIKISFVNISIEKQEFDIIVRDFFDTDENPVVLEKFSRCSMNPEVPGYVARKVGTTDGEYELKSKYIMLELSEDAPIDAVPAGFRGYGVKDYNFATASNQGVNYKTEYYTAGQVIGVDINGNSITVNADKLRKTYMGISNTVGFDPSFFEFSGDSVGVEVTKGFHLSSQADSSEFETSPENFELSEGNFEKLVGCKFTIAPAGGFDGFDVFRKERTNTDQYIIGKTSYSNSGFSSSYGESDYYAYLDGIMTFRNPEAVDINLFATPGINFFSHSSLVGEAIDMIEDERADSLYVIDSPNRDSVEEVVGDLEDIGFDTNYSATYWPWIQVRDTENAVQVYVPPTGEVLKNIALTDNVAYPWFASAGYTRGLVNAIKAKKKLTLDERDELYVNRINPIATFSDVGTIIFGNKTLQVRESALDRINVRRLLLQARKLISNVAVRLLFEQNDEVVRNEFLNLVNPILENIKRERGLTEFKVVLSSSPEDIDRNQLSGKIYIKPTRALEFIDIEFLVTPTGASFENI
jgi:hypothetical protein